MKITVGTLLALNDSPGTLAALVNVRNYKVMRLARVLQPEIRTAIEGRFALFTDENSALTGPSTRQAKPECIADILTAQAELANTEIDLDVTPLKLDDLTGAELSFSDVAALGPLVAE